MENEENRTNKTNKTNKVQYFAIWIVTLLIAYFVMDYGMTLIDSVLFATIFTVLIYVIENSLVLMNG